jgi:hypothetical protein
MTPIQALLRLRDCSPYSDFVLVDSQSARGDPEAYEVVCTTLRLMKSSLHIDTARDDMLRMFDGDRLIFLERVSTGELMFWTTDLLQYLSTKGVTK